MPWSVSCDIAAAMEQRHAEQILERPHPHRHRRLRDVELRRRLGEAQILRDAVESADLVEVHGSARLM